MICIYNRVTADKMTTEYKEKFKILKADEGKMLTAWNDGDDIIDFNSFSAIYSPLDADFTAYREITKEQGETLKEMRDEKMREVYGR